MKIKLLMALSLMLLAGSSVFAQTAAQPAGGAVPKMKVAIVDVVAFKSEVLELKVKYDKLNTEFAPKLRELETMQNTAVTKQKVLEENKTLTPQQQQKLAEEIEQLKKAYNRSLEDMQTAGQKREREETEAIYEKIDKALNQYFTKHGITAVFDVRRLQETGVIVHVKMPDANITADFIKEYNKANPVQAAAAPSK
ncbi:MAG: OmpH family outer membrane protein [Blastocatellia bacterium]